MAIILKTEGKKYAAKRPVAARCRWAGAKASERALDLSDEEQQAAYRAAMLQFLRDSAQRAQDSVAAGHALATESDRTDPIIEKFRRQGFNL